MGMGAGQHLCTHDTTRTLAEGFGGFQHNRMAAVCAETKM